MVFILILKSMKTIIYAFVAVIVFGILSASFTNKANTKSSILIQATDNSISIAALLQSKDVITARLKDFGAEKSGIELVPGKNQIRVTFTDKRNIELFKKLLTQKGVFAFYETYDHQSLLELLHSGNQLFSRFEWNQASNTGGRIGCISRSKTVLVNKYLDSIGISQRCKFAWSQFTEDDATCLYALRVDDQKGELLVGSDVESMQFEKDKQSNLNVIKIKFKEQAIQTWADATRRNMDHAIAIVMDDQVISAPVVRSIIEGGNCSITGSFSQEEAKFIVSLGNNGELPANFTIVK
jgi:preprotein translocase subunit SecD